MPGPCAVLDCYVVDRTLEGSDNYISNEMSAFSQKYFYLLKNILFNTTEVSV